MKMEPLPEWIDEARFALALAVACALWTGIMSLVALAPARRNLLRYAALGPLVYLAWLGYSSITRWLDITSVPVVLGLALVAVAIGILLARLLGPSRQRDA